MSQVRGIAYFESFGVTESSLLKTMHRALLRGATHADIFLQHRISHRLGLEDGAVNRASYGIDLGAGVRVVVGDQTGYAYTEDLREEALLEAASLAASIAQQSSAQERPISLQLTPTLSWPSPLLYEQHAQWLQVKTKDKIPLLYQLYQRAKQKEPSLQKINIGFSDAIDTILIIDQQGHCHFDIQPMTSLSLSCVAEKNGKQENNGYNVAARDEIGFYTPERIDKVADEAIARTLILFEATSPKAGEMPVVLAAGSSGILLHEAIGHGMEADFNRKGTSIYSQKIGKSIAAPFVNIVDDGTIAHARGAIHIDDEGTPAQKTYLVEKGTLATFLHDTISARHYGLNPTGNGRRESFRHAPMPRMRCTYMENGPHDHNEIIASVKKGIYCQTFANGQVQIGAGDFSFYVKNGYLIEDGRLTRPIKDVNLIGNGPRILEQIDMVAQDLVIDEGGWTCGKDGQSVPVSQGMPTVRVQSMSVGGQG